MSYHYKYHNRYRQTIYDKAVSIIRKKACNHPFWSYNYTP